MKTQPLVSIIIPVRGVDTFLEDCLNSIKKQTYPRVEVIIVDNDPGKNIKELARKYGAQVHSFFSTVKKGKFDAPHKRNFGVTKAHGEYIYYLDSDMLLSKSIISEAVQLSQKFDALIIPEDSFGVGIWAAAKQLERRCYWGDSSIEAARFFRKTVWKSLGGLDTSLGGGGDDWDLQRRLIDEGYKVGRTQAIVKHNEGALSLKKLIKKRFMYGRDSIKYLVKKPKQSFISYFPIRPSYFREWRMFIRQPLVTLAFICMRIAEYSAGFAGVLYSMVERER